VLPPEHGEQARGDAAPVQAPAEAGFRELQRAIDGISQRMLTLTVRRLERDGLVLRTVYPTVPAQVDYRLTETGASLTHLLKGLAEWSISHRPVIAEARRGYDQTHPDHNIR
jgi:DNA-binding HxlR family transcriptional regulator